MEEHIEEYTCSMCGITLAECKHWGPTCKRTGRRVCAMCCYKCENHVIWSGVWKCSFVTEEDRKAEIRARIQQRLNAEEKRISDIYLARKKQKAREYAIKQAKARKRASTKGEKTK